MGLGVSHGHNVPKMIFQNLQAEPAMMSENSNVCRCHAFPNSPNAFNPTGWNVKLRNYQATSGEVP